MTKIKKDAFLNSLEIKDKQRFELYYNFFLKIYKEVNNFKNTNPEKLTRISNHIKDTLILHGQINGDIKEPIAVLHKYRDIDP